MDGQRERAISVRDWDESYVVIWMLSTTMRIGFSHPSKQHGPGSSICDAQKKIQMHALSLYQGRIITFILEHKRLMDLYTSYIVIQRTRTSHTRDLSKLITVAIEYMVAMDTGELFSSRQKSTRNFSDNVVSRG